MIDFANIEKYKENNRIEAKKSLGGLPHSIWETYCAFANTLGGIILLGVEEYRDKSFHVVDLPDPQGLIKEFWEIVNNPKRVSANILSENDVNIEIIDGKHIVAITVPRAQRSDKPVYVEGNPFSGSYRRSGEGDYKCTREEVEAMIRDAQAGTRDMTLLENVELDAIDRGSVKRYRERMKSCRPEHPWHELDCAEFLYNLGALGRADDGKMHPTVAGLLMFGYEREIAKEFPEYSLTYEEIFGSDESAVSSPDAYSGNVFDFYFEVCDKIVRDIKVSTEMESEVHKAIREALINALINADYYGKNGIVIIKKKDIITLSNPGGFRIDVEAAKGGGISDPRNSALVKMFNLIDVGSNTGSGIPNIFSVWKKAGWSAPVISESFDPDRITLLLAVGKKRGKRAAEKSAAHKQAIISYLTENISANRREIAGLLGLAPARAKEILDEMVEADLLVAEGEKRKTVYKLKA